jgi:hypothetical protein
LTARVNETWTYRIVALDEDGDELKFSMAGTPDGMVLNSPNGTLSWTPRAGQEGDHTIAVSVSDGKGGLGSQIFGLSVRGIPPPPVVLPICTIDRPGNGTTAKGTLNLAGRAFNGSFPLAAVHFRIDGGPWQTARGLSNWTSSLDTGKLSNGPHTLEARAYDGIRYSNTTAVLFNVQNPSERVSTGNQYCQPTLILATILGLVFVLSVAFRKKNNPA